MMRTLDAHACARRHRNAAAFVRCRWPGAHVTGEGLLAVLARCGPVTVALFPRLDPARTYLSELDVFGCCPTCNRDHELLALDIDAEPETAP